MIMFLILKLTKGCVLLFGPFVIICRVPFRIQDSCAFMCFQIFKMLGGCSFTGALTVDMYLSAKLKGKSPKPVVEIVLNLTNQKFVDNLLCI